MSRRMTKRERLERAAAREWMREEAAAEARLRAEEPALAAIDEAQGELARADRALERFAAENAFVLALGARSDTWCREAGCTCDRLGCQAARLIDEAVAAGAAVSALCDGKSVAVRRAAERRVQDKRRRELGIPPREEKDHG